MARARGTTTAGGVPVHGGDPGPAVLVGFVVAVTLARIAILAVSASELSFDEAQYWAWSRDPAFGYFTKPPMIAWAMALEEAVCGTGATCLRAGSAVVHGATALVLAALAGRLYGRATGFWTAVVYTIAPGIALSAFLMTTDVLLLFWWSVALYALAVFLERPGWAGALCFGLACGLGLNAKYAMIYLPAMVALAAIAEPRVRRAVLRIESAAALALMAALIAPNMLWNLENGMATFVHTGENIGWSLDRLNAVKGLSFFAAQFAVAGPVVFAVLLGALALGWRSERPETDRLLVYLSLPLVGVLTVQGFLAQANANWAAPAHLAGLVLATALIVRMRTRLAFAANLVICGAVTLTLWIGTATFDPTAASGPLRKLRELGGWAETAAALAGVARERAADTIVTAGRPLTAAMIYALRDLPVRVLAYLPPGALPSDQFQLDRPWRAGDAADGTLLFGFPADQAARLGAQVVATIDAPIYMSAGRRMDVYGFAAPASR